MSSLNRRRTGSIGENIARRHLEKHGYIIRERNLRSKDGEIDIIAEKEAYLVFVEVRTRTSSSFGTPEESITSSKKEKLITLAEGYLQSHSGLPPYWRIDVVAVEMEQSGRVRRVEIIENAVS